MADPRSIELTECVRSVHEDDAGIDRRGRFRLLWKASNREEVRGLGRAPAPSMRAAAPDRLLTGNGARTPDDAVRLEIGEGHG
jgi:hypothetical protein